MDKQEDKKKLFWLGLKLFIKKQFLKAIFQNKFLAFSKTRVH